jgi:hypothetical protein
LGITLKDATYPGLILFGLAYAGMVWFLAVDIRFYAINSTLLAVEVSAMFLGLFLGLLTGNWITKEQLKSLGQKSELRGFGSKRLFLVELIGIAVVFACFIVGFQYQIALLLDGLIDFVIPGGFALYLIHLRVISSWEQKNRGIVMFGWYRIYLNEQDNTKV